jgi:G3E family GTPase
MEPSKDKIPVGIITGFLGAGKTTLLNNLIRDYPDKRFAIIENEFGEIGIDSELVLNVDNSNICELANGCICCSLNDDLAGLVKDLLYTGRPFDYLLIETTGIADPSSVIQPFFSDADIRSSFTMDSVICLVDALHFEPSYKQQEEVHRQVAIADLILLNKASEADGKSLTDIMGILGSVNPQAEIIQTDHAEIRNHSVLDRQAYRKDRIASYSLAPFASGPGKPGYNPADMAAQWMVQDPRPDHSIASFSFQFPGNFDLERFSYWMEYFLYINQANIFRIKGILSFADNPQKMILQTVRSSYLLEDWEFWAVGEERVNRLIFIGKDIPYADIREALESLMC